jgi:hypothetical protein
LLILDITEESFPDHHLLLFAAPPQHIAISHQNILLCFSCSLRPGVSYSLRIFVVSFLEYQKSNQGNFSSITGFMLFLLVIAAGCH